VIPNGTFTLVGPRGRRTFQVKTWHKEDGDKRVVSVLTGPDNESDYLGVAFLNEDGSVVTWRRHQGTEWDRLAQSFGTLMRRAGDGEPIDHGQVYRKVEYGGSVYEIWGEERCIKCGRKLTVPASIHRGMGPICASGGMDG
jgi:hypothetical protein